MFALFSEDLKTVPQISRLDDLQTSEDVYHPLVGLPPPPPPPPIIPRHLFLQPLGEQLAFYCYIAGKTHKQFSSSAPQPKALLPLSQTGRQNCAKIELKRHLQKLSFHMEGLYFYVK